MLGCSARAHSHHSSQPGAVINEGLIAPWLLHPSGRLATQLLRGGGGPRPLKRSGMPHLTTRTALVALYAGCMVLPPSTAPASQPPSHEFARLDCHAQLTVLPGSALEASLQIQPMAHAIEHLTSMIDTRGRATCGAEWSELERQKLYNPVYGARCTRPCPPRAVLPAPQTVRL
jgi:hypothetical protein